MRNFGEKYDPKGILNLLTVFHKSKVTEGRLKKLYSLVIKDTVLVVE
jgi:hypothetical protein